jgi:uncharacterized protein with GYD domain
MPTYVVLYKLTEQGVKNIKSAPERIEAGIKAAEAMGGKVLGFYATLGEYDYVSISEAPSDEVAMTFMLGLGAQGNVRTTTLKAFTKEELAEMVKKLP